MVGRLCVRVYHVTVACRRDIAMKLQGTVGILSGASRGIGINLAEHLARRGVSLALAARSAEGLERTAEGVRALGVEAIAVPTDVSDRNDLEALVKRTSEELGPIDLLVNNAGIERYARFDELELDLIEAIIATNLTASEILTRLVLPGMIERRRGHIVNISSLAGKTALPYNTVYTSTKHALVGFSWSLREEVKTLGIGVSVVCPTFIADTGMFANSRHYRDAPRIAGVVSPEKVAGAVIKAIESDRAEILVAKGLGKMVDVFHALSPAFTTGASRRTGLYAFLKRQASSEAR
jgi:short-subunit dehydrogenase